MSADPVLRLEHVAKHYGDFPAVSDISLTVPRGSIYGFLGPNGAGKTTTLRMILDIVRPTSGRMKILGAASATPVRHRLGYLPEEKGLYKKMRVAETLVYFAMLKGVSRAAARERAAERLEHYGLGAFANSRIEALSKGMGQKVQVLAAVAHDPEFVVLDEPFSGLDPVNQQILEQLVRDLQARGTTILFSTHVMAHAERLCDRLLLIADGACVFDGTAAEARSLLPQRIRLTTTDDLSPLVQALGLPPPLRLGESPNGVQWQLDVAEHLAPQLVLRACLDHGIHLHRFENAAADLHDVFVHLVGHATVRQPAR